MNINKWDATIKRCVQVIKPFQGSLNSKIMMIHSPDEKYLLYAKKGAMYEWNLQENSGKKILDSGLISNATINAFAIF